MSKVLMIIAKEGFRDVEYFVPREILENAGHSIKVSSNGNKGETAIGADGGKVKIDLNLSEAKADDFDAVVFIGGPGALKNLDNEQSYRLAKEVIFRQTQDKLLAAICISPIILAKAGVLKGKKATVWSAVSDKGGVKVLKERGADYVDQDVVEDGNIITANSPQAAKAFGEKLASYFAKSA